MATAKTILQENSVLKLVLEFLSARNYHKSARTLEKEAGVTTNPYSENINFFRELVLDGDWPAVKEFGEPLADVPSFEYRRFNFLIAKQEYLEILFEKCDINNEQSLRDGLLVCLQNLEKYSKFKEEYNKLYWYLSVPSLRSEPEFSNWSIDSSRMHLFEEMLQLLKQFIPIRDQHPAVVCEDRLLNLLFNGLLYENCIEFCQKQALGKTGVSDCPLTNINMDVFRKQSLKSSGNFYSWLHSLPPEDFAVQFEPLNFDLQLEERKKTRVHGDIKNSSLSQSLTIELQSPTKSFMQNGRTDHRKRFSNFPQTEPSDFSMRDVSQSFAEFKFDRRISNGPHRNFNSNTQEVFLRNGEVSSELSGSYASNISPKPLSSPRKVRRDQQDLVLQQLEEHKQRQRKLYEQLAETATLASGRIKDIVANNVTTEESNKSLEAVGKSKQNVKLLSENFDRLKTSQVHIEENGHAKKVVSSQHNFHPEPVSAPCNVVAKKSSSSTPGSASLPKTPVNTCLPPGLVNLTDGSGAFNTSTPKAERQSFTTPLPASPVTLEREYLRNDDLVSQSQQGNIVPEERNRRLFQNGETPKAAGSKHPPVRRSLVDTVFQNDGNSPHGENSTYIHGAVDSIASKRTHLRFDTATVVDKKKEIPSGTSQSTAAFTAKNEPLVAKFNGGNIDEKINATAETKELKSQNSFAPKKVQVSDNCSRSRPTNPRVQETAEIENPESANDSALKNSDCKDARFHGAYSLENALNPHNRRLTKPPTNCTKNPPSLLANPRSNPEAKLQTSLKFQKSAMLSDVQAIRAVVFHPSGDYFAVGTNSKALKICRMTKRNENGGFERDDQEIPLLEVLCEKSSIHKGSVYCVAFNDSGRIIATGSNDKTIKVSRFNERDPVSLEDGIELAIHSATVRDLTFVNAGNHPVLASGGAGGGLIHLSDCETGQTVQSLQGHAGNVMAVYASDQAHVLCSGSADKTVRIWDLRMTKCVDVVTTSSCVNSVCFNFSTTHSLLSASADDSGQCLVYDVGARKCITSFNPHTMDCRSIRFSPDSQYILTGSYDACVAITAVQYDRNCVSDSRVVARHNDKVIQCRWHPSEYVFLSSSADRTVVLWENTLLDS